MEQSKQWFTACPKQLIEDHTKEMEKNLMFSPVLAITLSVHWSDG